MMASRNNMTFADLVRSVSWAEVEPRIPHSPYEPDLNLEGYRLVFDELRRLEAVASRMRIVLREHVEPAIDEEPTVEVLGRNGQLNRDQSDVGGDISGLDRAWLDSETDFALSFAPWGEWLGMQIDPDSLERYSGAEIVAYCLWDMTFHGFEQDQVIEVLEDLRRRVDEIETMSPEEREQNLIPADEVFRMLDRDEDEKEAT